MATVISSGGLINATKTIWKVLRHHPEWVKPDFRYNTFKDIPIPLSNASENIGPRPMDIKGLILDKDNCFATPDTNVVKSEYKETFLSLLKHYSPENILIVSNSAGLKAHDPKDLEASMLQSETGVQVLRHFERKPWCMAEVMPFFRGKVESPSEIAVVGDSLLTDVALAHIMGARSFWLSHGAEGKHPIEKSMEEALFIKCAQLEAMREQQQR